MSGICRRYAEPGMAGPTSGPRGPAPGTGRFLLAQQEVEIRDVICRTRWAFTAQKPLRRAYEQPVDAVQRWLRHEYPAIKARAKQEKGAAFSEEAELRSWGEGRLALGRRARPQLRASWPHACGAPVSQAGGRGLGDIAAICAGARR